MTVVSDGEDDYVNISGVCITWSDPNALVMSCQLEQTTSGFFRDKTIKKYRYDNINNNIDQ